MLCQIVIGPQFQNFTLKYCFLTWRMLGLNNFLLLPVHKSLCRGGMSSSIFSFFYNFELSFWRVFFDVKERYYFKKILIFKASVIF